MYTYKYIIAASGHWNKKIKIIYMYFPLQWIHFKLVLSVVKLRHGIQQ